MTQPESLGSQVGRLAQFIVDSVPGEPSQSEGAVDTAIRVMTTLQARVRELEEALGTLLMCAHGDEHMCGCREQADLAWRIPSITSTTCRECGGSGRFRVGYFPNHEEFERTGPDEVCGVCGGSGTATMTDNTPMDLTDDERARVEGAMIGRMHCERGGNK